MLFIINNVCGGIFRFHLIFESGAFSHEAKSGGSEEEGAKASDLPGRGRFCGFASAKVRRFFVQVIIKTSCKLITSYKYVRNLMILFKIERFDKMFFEGKRRIFFPFSVFCYFNGIYSDGDKSIKK